jgi:hypothetical protein
MSLFPTPITPLTKEEVEMLTGGYGSGGTFYGGRGSYPTPTSVGTGATSYSGLVSLLKASQRQKVVSDLVEDGYWVKMTGSRVTKDGWTDDSDWDYVVFDPDCKLQDVYTQSDGWVLGSDAGQGEFASIRKGEINLILVTQEDIWKKYIIATNLIKAINCKTKEERIGIFDTVFGKTSDSKAMDFGAPF